jgi:hypothetical protein
MTRPAGIVGIGIMGTAMMGTCCATVATGSTAGTSRSTGRSNTRHLTADHFDIGESRADPDRRASSHIGKFVAGLDYLRPLFTAPAGDHSPICSSAPRRRASRKERKKAAAPRAR